MSYKAVTRKMAFPSYNFGWRGITEDVKKYSVEIMKLMDRITVSSQYLKYYISEVLKVNVPIEIVPNSIPMYFWEILKEAHYRRYQETKNCYTGFPNSLQQSRKNVR